MVGAEILTRVLKRAGIVITGTEVLTGSVQDRNGPWLSEQLAALGVEPAHILVVGDRPRDIAAALRFMAQERVDLIVTSGGLGPTADDLTAQVVGEFQGREMMLDEPLRGRIAEILKPLAERHPHLDRDAIEEGNRKQATIPAGSTVLEPVGTAPGLLVAPVDAVREHPPIVVLPGPPSELQPMWERALQDGSLHAAVPQGQVARVRTLRLFGIPESEIALTLREAHRAGVEMSQLEVTTCLRGGEIEVVTRFQPAAQPVYDAFEEIVAGRHADTLYSRDGSTVDEQLAALLSGDFGSAEQADHGRREPGVRGTRATEDTEPRISAGARRTVAVAESCTGGLLLARLTARPGASAYVVGGVVAYSNEVKIAEAGVPRETIERHGAVSEQVARALADGIRERMGADVGVGVTGIAGPGGGSEEKPVGLVWVSVSDSGRSSLTRSVRLPGNRADVRDRAVTVAMHLLRRTLNG